MPIEKYNTVLIVGPDSPITEAMKEAFHEEKGNIIIGDGINYVTPQQLESLRGNVDSRTAFHLCGHGSIDKDYKGLHSITILENVESSSSATPLLFSKINELVEHKPVEVHIWSCYASDVLYHQESTLPNLSLIHI